MICSQQNMFCTYTFFCKLGLFGSKQNDFAANLIDILAVGFTVLDRYLFVKAASALSLPI